MFVPVVGLQATRTPTSSPTPLATIALIGGGSYPIESRFHHPKEPHLLTAVSGVVTRQADYVITAGSDSKASRTAQADS